MSENVSPPSLNSQNQEDKKPRSNLYTWLFENPKNFFWAIVLLGIAGGLLALTIPECLINQQFANIKKDDIKVEEIRQKSISDLRLHLLYIIGGMIAILTLLQNYWKNYNDKIKSSHDIDVSIKNMELEEISRWNHESEDRRRKFAEFEEKITTLKKEDINTYIDCANIWMTKTPEKYETDAIYECQKIIDALCRTLKEQGNNSTENITYALQKISFLYSPSMESNILWKKIKYNFSNLWIGKPLSGLNLHNVDFSEARFAPDTGFTSCTFSGKCSFWRAKTSGSFHIISSKITGKISFIGFLSKGEFKISDAEVTETDLFEFMNARFFNNSLFEKINFSEKDTIGLNHAFPKTYFSNNHSHIFKSNVKTNLAPRTLKGKKVEIPIESVLFDPNTYEFEFQNLEITADHYII